MELLTARTGLREGEPGPAYQLLNKYARRARAPVGLFLFPPLFQRAFLQKGRWTAINRRCATGYCMGSSSFNVAPARAKVPALHWPRHRHLHLSWLPWLFFFFETESKASDVVNLIAAAEKHFCFLANCTCNHELIPCKKILMEQICLILFLFMSFKNGGKR
ncbi:hypothetical protein CEXT_532281 [Caerostris extrusa]|uniref:Uncharacterized protein n=1 Tax=Caerostris extrusa TaxID=172846 RepID=A0AAV4SW84_CAEEX|nr:hypothetical protein CEXT_532281 [Caerostris extrusa]